MSRLVADIGSTFTKVRLFGPDGRLEWSAQAPTRPRDVRATEDQLRAAATADGVAWPPGRIAACSSAAGGLRLAVLGLTRTFTFDAAMHAALGAGARIVARFSGALDPSNVLELAAAGPDVVLLTGGSDDGDRNAAVEFARALAGVDQSMSVVIACNRAAAEECRTTLERAGHRPVVVANVMPELGRVDFEPARGAIREIFLENVIGRLGEQRDHSFDVVAPTPAAVVAVTELLSDLGSLSTVVIDVGGATTDVHSSYARKASPTDRLSLAASQRSSRTVEADLGLRESAPSLLAAGLDASISDPPGTPAELEASVERLREAVDTVTPDDPFDRWLVRAAATIALRRHVGTWEPRMTAEGVRLTPVGRDLRDVGWLIGTGGALSRDASEVLATVADSADERYLTPLRPEITNDRDYVLPGIGVLALVDPQLGRIAATRLLAARLESTQTLQPTQRRAM